MAAAAVEALAGRDGHYGYVSSRSVYRWPIAPGLDETETVFDGDAGSTDDKDYAAAKPGAELAVLDGFGEAALVARAGLIVGPCELVGPLPCWLRRIELGGRVLCPGPPDLALQYIDGRDLAPWMLDMADGGRRGVFNTVSSTGHTTMESSSRPVARLPEATPHSSGSPPMWLSDTASRPDRSALLAPADWACCGPAQRRRHGGRRSGLRGRSVGDTIAATWQWLQAERDPESLTAGSIGLDPTKEPLALS
jgi:hypothetical protein